MMKRKPLLVLLSMAVAAAGSMTTPLARDGRPQLVVDVVAMKEVVQRDAAGRQTVQLTQVDTTGPGDTLVYRIVYRNAGTEAAHDAQVVDPIPAGTVLVPDSWDTKGGEFTVSVDAGKSFERYPVRQSVTQADGTTRLENVALSAYTHVRWTTKEPLPPGAARSTAFKVTVR